MTYDLIIIGGGPAGVAAGVYAARKRLKSLLVASEWGGQSIVSEGIENWIGTIKISGTDLAKNLKAHLDAYRSDIVDVHEGMVSSIAGDALNGFTATTDKGATFSSRSVLIATGSTRRKLTIPGADVFEHKGVTYCASCDGPMFSGMDVVVVGGGNAAFETAAQLLAYAKSVTLLQRGDKFRADEVTVAKVLSHPNMKAVTNTELIRVEGEGFVTGLVYKDAANNKEITLPCSGIFVEIGLIPTTEYAKEIVELDKTGHVVVDPRTQKTKTPGIWAAGDCTDGLYHQNNIAAGDAVKALEDIYVTLKAS